MQTPDTIALNEELLAQLKTQDYAGYDPFDMLNSRVFTLLKLNKFSLLRLAWLQFGKRSPINFRSLLLVPEMRNPKGVALVILGLLNDYQRTQDETYLDEAKHLADWLLTQMSDQSLWQYPCWGYHFDWQARAFFVPKGKPNIITTCYVARALYELGTLVDSQEYIRPALQSAHFIQQHLFINTKNALNNLNNLNKEDRCFYAYIPGETAFVHNASLWGAAWVAFCGHVLADNSLVESGIKVALQSISEQANDGSWVYGARNHHQFIDGFHTGYNLEALDLLASVLRQAEQNRQEIPSDSSLAVVENSIEKGLDYYRQNLFTTDGTAKYYHDNVYPLDMHNFTQAILTLLKVGKPGQVAKTGQVGKTGELGKTETTDADLALVDRVVARSIEHLYLPELKRFAYQKSRHLTNRINYMRWTQAWSYYGLAFYHNKRRDLT